MNLRYCLLCVLQRYPIINSVVSFHFPTRRVESWEHNKNLPKQPDLTEVIFKIFIIIQSVDLKKCFAYVNKYYFYYCLLVLFHREILMMMMMMMISLVIFTLHALIKVIHSNIKHSCTRMYVIDQESRYIILSYKTHRLNQKLIEK